MSTLLHLPDEILLNILGHFRVNDLKSLRLTCKRFYLLSLDKHIIKKECLLLNECVFKKRGRDIVSALMTSNRKIGALLFKNDNYYYETKLPEDLLVNVVAKFGENVTEVIFDRTNVEFSRIFKSVIDYCPNLQMISINDCNDIFLQESFFFYNRKLLKMKTLKIYETKYLTDLILFRLFTLCPNLEEITLSSCGMNMHNGVYGKFYKEDPSDALQPSNDVLSYKYLLYLLSGLNCITELNLSFSTLSHKSLMQIFQLPNLKLHKLNLMACREISWNQLFKNDIFYNQTSITHLNLSHSLLVYSQILLHICDNLLNLESLNLANCFAITDEGFNNIQKLTKLRDLNINNNHELSGNVLSKLLKCNLHSYRALHSVIDSNQIIDYLTKLKLRVCEIGFILKRTCFGNEAIREINKSQIYLKELHIHSLSITDDAFIGITIKKSNTDKVLESKFMNSLTTTREEYNLRENMEKFKQLFHYDVTESELAISNLRNLEILNLDCCQNITDYVFKYSMDLPYLRKLSLGSTKITFVGICYLIQKCPNIEHLDLENTQVNDAAVCILVQGLPKLTNLSLKNCSKLTSLSYKLIIKHCHQLKALHGWNPFCSDVDVDVNTTLMQIFNLPNMSKLNARRYVHVKDASTTLLPY